MKAKIFTLAAAIAVLSVSISRAHAGDVDDKDGHLEKIKHNLDVKVDKVADKLKYHTEKTERSASRMAERIYNFGKKIDRKFEQAADKVGERLEKLSE
jgi:hypothetical protein